MRAAVLIGAVLLAGCGDWPTTRTEAEIREIARDELRPVRYAVDKNASVSVDEFRRLNDRLDSQEAEIQRLRQQINLIEF